MNATIHIRQISNGFVVSTNGVEQTYAYDRIPDEQFYATQAELVQAMPLIAANAIAVAQAERERYAQQFERETAGKQQAYGGDYPRIPGVAGAPIAEPEVEPVEEVATLDEFLHAEPVMQAAAPRNNIEADEQGFGTNGS